MCSRVEQLGRFCHPECGLIGHGSKIWHRRDWSCGCGQYARSALAVPRRSGAATAADSAAGPSRHAPKRCYCSAGDQALGSAPASSLSPRLPRTGVAAYFWLMSRHQKSFQQPFGVGRFASSPFRHAGPARISPRMGPLGGDPPGNAHGDRQLPAPRAHQPLRKRRPCGHPAGLPSQHKPDP